MTNDPHNENDPSDRTGDLADGTTGVTTGDTVDSWLAAMGRAPVPGPSAGYVDGLEAELRATHAERGRPPRAVRVLVPVLAAAAMILAVAFVARPGGSPMPADLANDGFRPGFTSSTTAGGTDRDGGADDSDRGETDQLPEDRDEPSPSRDDAPSDTSTPTTTAVRDDPAPEPDPVPGPTRSTLPPERSTTTTSSTPTTEPQAPLRLAASRTDDGRILLRWTDPGRDDVAGWRLRRVVRTSDRESAETILVTRNPATRRHLDTPPPDVDRITYVIVAVDADGNTVAEARTTLP